MTGASSEIAGQDVVVVGLGRSGVAAAKLCARHGARVIATDRRPLDELSTEAQELDARLCVGGHDEVDFGAADTIVLSPGVPSLAPIAEAKAKGVTVVGELELAWGFCSAPVLQSGAPTARARLLLC